MKLITTLGVGVVAGTAATVTMSAFMAVAKRLGALGEPPPRKIVRGALRRVGLRPRGRALDLAGLAAHVAFGAAAGVLFASMPKKRHRIPAMAFGLGVWLVSYAGVLPQLRLMPKPSRDRPMRPTAMALAHIVYGATLGEVSHRLTA
ncbi:MAG: DUF6789 family protein [Polyangiales bacterium]